MAEYVNLDNARHDDQREVMKEIADNAECPFCPENLAKYHKNPILRSGDFWVLTQSQWPYAFTRMHLLAIAKTHVKDLTELPPGSGDELMEHMSWACAEYSISAGGLAMRFGDITRTGASVNHLHSHLIVPDENKPPEEKVRFKIS